MTARPDPDKGPPRKIAAVLKTGPGEVEVLECGHWVPPGPLFAFGRPVTSRRCVKCLLGKPRDYSARAVRRLKRGDDGEKA